MNITPKKPLFILVDDDPINNSISRLTIINAVPNAEVLIFTNPKTGLRFITEDFIEHPATSVVLFLNLNMPFMSGWEFLERFNELNIAVQERIRIYILSSSIDLADRKKSETIGCVRGFLTKPLSSRAILGS